MPEKGNSRLKVNGAIGVRVWRGEERTDLTEIGGVLHLTPGATGSFTEELPEALSSGKVRVLYYFVDLLDRDGSSTGLSNYVPTIAGGPPHPVEGFTAEIADAGVLLRWNPPVAGEESGPMVVHIRRVVLFDRLTDEKQWLSSHSSFEQDLFIQGGSQSVHTTDKDVQHGYTYDYKAQYVAQLPVSKQTVLELRGAFSAPACIHIEKAVVSDSGAKSIPVPECP